MIINSFFALVIMAVGLLPFRRFLPLEKTLLRVEVFNFSGKPLTKVYVSVFSQKEFLEKSIETKSVLVEGDKIAIEFDLPPGEYAVSTYQDINKNGKLDRHFYGKPKEPYGFSNNIKPFGPPAYKDCKITLSNAPKTISIKLLN